MQLNPHEVRSVLEELGLRRIKVSRSNKGVDYRFCCPFHGERNPSAGVVVASDGVYGQCFTCKETFSLPKLVAQCLDLTIIEGVQWIEERFNVSYRFFEARDKPLRRYDEAIEEETEKPTRTELPYYKLAPYRSGKETHKYFFERGFDAEDVRVNMIGWDRVRKRITIPLFHPDGVLAGFSGRAVLDDKVDGKKNLAYKKIYGDQPKYYLYDNVPIGEILYGSHDFYSEDGTAILVEGLLDRMWMRKMGFRNALSTIVAKLSFDKKTMSSRQAAILLQLGVKKVIFMQDNDDAGREGKEVAYKILREDFTCYDTDYPEPYKDVLGNPKSGLPPMSREQIQEMLDNKWLYGRTRRELRRYE